MEGCLLEEDLVVARAEAARLAQQLADRSDGDSAVRGIWFDVVARRRHARAQASDPLLVSSTRHGTHFERRGMTTLARFRQLGAVKHVLNLQVAPDADTCILLQTG